MSSRPLFPRAGATYHILREAFGPAWGFVKVWMEAWVSAPGSIAGIAIVFGEFAVSFLGGSAGPAQIWGIGAVFVFAGINLMGVEWGGRTQVILDDHQDHGVAGPGGRKLFAR